MKTNLHKSWKTNDKVEIEGVAYAVGEDAFIIVKRMGGANQKSVEAAFAKHYQPYAGAIQRGTFSKDKENEVMARIMSEAIVTGWEGICNEDGNAIEYTKENVQELLQDLPELRKELMEFSQNPQNFSDSADYKTVILSSNEKEDLGNS